MVEVLLRSQLQLMHEDDTDRKAASEEVSPILNPIARKKASHDLVRDPPPKKRNGG